jgi:hypothetical protein
MTKKQEKELLIIGGLAVAVIAVIVLTQKKTVTPTPTLTVSNAVPQSGTQYLENQGVTAAADAANAALQSWF